MSSATCPKRSGMAIGCARHAVHAGPSLRRPRRTLCREERGSFWNSCTRANSNLAAPLSKRLYDTQWRQRLGNFGLTQSGRYPGGRKSPSGVQGRRPNGGLIDEPPKLTLILEMDVKVIFYEGKIENAYMSRRFLKRTRAAVLSIHDNRHSYIRLLCMSIMFSLPSVSGGYGDIAIPHRKFCRVCVRLRSSCAKS